LNRHYFFAIDTNSTNGQGPIPVVAQPWGNGWGTGAITHYVQIDNSQPGFFGVYSFKPDSIMTSSVYLGRPLSSSTPTNTSTLSFSLDISQLTTNGSPLNQIDVNIITTDILPVNPYDSVNKLYDALGTSGQNYITINLQSNQIYRNADASEPETQGDTPDPDLDIIDWQIEVRHH
jgi:hypothetical protein